MVIYLILAVLFGVVEALTGTFWLMAAAIVSMGMSALLWALPDINSGCHLASLVILSAVVWFGVHRFKKNLPEVKPQVNLPLTRYIGEIGKVVEGFKSGFSGKIQIGDVYWEANTEVSGQTFEVEDDVKVVAVTDSGVMIVHKIVLE